MNKYWYSFDLKDPHEGLTASIDGMGDYKQRIIYSEPGTDRLIVCVTAESDPVKDKSLKGKGHGKPDRAATKVKKMKEADAKAEIEGWA